MLLYSKKIEDEIRGKLTFRWIVNNESERLAIVPTEDEINMLCLELDSFKVYGLSSINPNVWLSPFPNGKSAYEVAVENGFEGSAIEWLKSLKGEKGDPFKISKTYSSKEELEADKSPGLTIGEMAVVSTDENNPDNGRLYTWTGTEFSFILDLSGIQGIKGLSAYEVAVENGFSGDTETWLKSLIGLQGSFGGSIANYTENEEKTAKIWSDGRLIYRKVINFGALPVAEEGSVPHNITDFDFAIAIYGVAFSEEEGRTLPLPRVYTNSVSNIALYIDALNVYIRTADNYSKYNGLVVIEYTKKNDTKLSDNEIQKLQFAWLDGIPLTTIIPSGNLSNTDAEKYGFIKIQHEKKYIIKNYDELYQIIKSWKCVKNDTELFWFDLTQDTSDTTILNTFLGKNSEIGSQSDDSLEYKLSLYAWMKAKKTVMSFLPLNSSDAIEFLQSVKLGTDGVPEWNGESWRGGQEGLSAYEIAVKNGFEGSESEWLASFGGIPGFSAYEVAKENGFEGTEEEWLNSLKGDPGKSAYEIALNDGFQGSVDDWLASLKGSNGKSAYEVAKENGFEGSESDFINFLKGEKGNKGDPGKSAYEIAIENGFEGTEEEWLNSFVNGAKWGSISGSISAQTDLMEIFNDIHDIVTVKIDNKVDKVDGKQLSTNDYTNEDKILVGKIETKIDTIIPGENVSIDQFGSKVIISAKMQEAEWGSISGALSAQTDLLAELNNKVNKINGKQLSTNDYTNEDKEKLKSIDNKLEAKNIIEGKNINIDTQGNNVIISGPDIVSSSWGNITGEIEKQEDLKVKLDSKVDKVDGKQLSTNDYTDEDKEKLKSIDSKLEAKNIIEGKNIEISVNENNVIISANDQKELEWGTITGSLSAQSDLVDIINSLTSSMNDKVDKDNGKQLSTNDYTNEDKNLVKTINSKVEKVEPGKNIIVSRDGSTVTISASDVYGESAYEIAVKNGFEGSESEWLNSLKGEKGDPGEPFKISKTFNSISELNGDGLEDGSFVMIVTNENNEDNAKVFVYSNNEFKFLVDLSGLPGIKGENGKSAYEIAIEKGFVGTEEEWLNSLTANTTWGKIQGNILDQADLNNKLNTKLEIQNIKEGKNIKLDIDNNDITISAINENDDIKWGTISGSLSAQSDLTELINNINDNIDKKVNKIDGKTLSTNDYSNEDKLLVQQIANKLESKNIKEGKNIAINVQNNDVIISAINQENTNWGEIKGDITNQLDLNAELNKKVDKIENKQLSTNDYSDDDKELVLSILDKLEVSNIKAGENIKLQFEGNNVTISSISPAISGENGKSAYEIAVEQGFEGSKIEWLTSLRGPKGSDGLSAYDIAVKNGFEGTESEWLNSLNKNDEIEKLQLQINELKALIEEKNS